LNSRSFGIEWKAMESGEESASAKNSGGRRKGEVSHSRHLNPRKKKEKDTKKRITSESCTERRRKKRSEEQGGRRWSICGKKAGMWEAMNISGKEREMGGVVG